MSVHSSKYQPRVYPIGGDAAAAEIDRLQDLSATTTLNREKRKEIGRDGVVGYKSGIPEVSLSLRQLEYGSLEFWLKVGNKSDSDTVITQADFEDSQINLAAYKTNNDSSSTFLGTMWWQKLRVSGWGISIGDPDADIERSVNLVGEDEVEWEADNKYVIYLEDTASGSGHQVVIGSGGFANYPDPVADPDESGSKYFILAYRIRGSVQTELVEGTDYSFNTTTNLISGLSSQSGDVFKFWYTASTYITSGDFFVENDSDLSGISADSCTILLETSNTVSRLQSVSIDVSFDRQDQKEIGSSEVVSRGIREKTVRISLSQNQEDVTLEQLLRGAATDYGKYDVRNFQDSLKITVKIYSDKTKSTFKMGYSFTQLSPVSTDSSIPTSDFMSKGVTLEGELFTITNVEGSL